MTRPERLTQFEKALLELRSLILSGAFEANVRLPEVALAERLGISRTPLRQAIDRLISEGLLERIPTGGCRVASFTVDEIRDSIEMRGVIEGTAARLAAERGVAPDLLAEAEQVLDRIDMALLPEEGMEFDTYVRCNARFHDLLAQFSGSLIVRREVERVCRLPLASPSAFLQEQEVIPDFKSSLIRAQQQHRALLSAIGNREGTRAEALCREHARLAQQNLDHLTRADPSLAIRVPGLALVSAV
ncbi:MAG: GntR family transcriptional regulator [Qingshengfaniella sp.]